MKDNKPQFGSMGEVITAPGSPRSMAARAANRMKGSNEPTTADETFQHGTGPRRLSGTIHRSGSVGKHGKA
jgi:hypothetical protein